LWCGLETCTAFSGRWQRPSAPAAERRRILFWQEQMSSQGALDADSMTLEVEARGPALRSLEMKVARTHGDITLFEFLELPRKLREPGYRIQPKPPASRSIALLATIRARQPALVLEALTEPPLLGDLTLSKLNPQIDRLSRRAPSSESLGLVVLCIGCLASDGLLAAGMIGPGLALVSIFTVGGGGRLLAIRVMDWLFPALELLPDDRAATRWQRTKRIASTVGAILVGVASVLALAVTLTHG
jgi:hypothetical protein